MTARPPLPRGTPAGTREIDARVLRRRLPDRALLLRHQVDREALLGLERRGSLRLDGCHRRRRRLGRLGRLVGPFLVDAARRPAPASGGARCAPRSALAATGSGRSGVGHRGRGVRLIAPRGLGREPHDGLDPRSLATVRRVGPRRADLELALRRDAEHGLLARRSRCDDRHGRYRRLGRDADPEDRPLPRGCRSRSYR